MFWGAPPAADAKMRVSCGEILNMNFASRSGKFFIKSNEAFTL